VIAVTDFRDCGPARKYFKLRQIASKHSRPAQYPAVLPAQAEGLHRKHLKT